MTNKHSELPWKARSAEDTNWWFILEDKDGLEIGSGDGGLEECDAQLIVTAVNYHHRLREALQKCIDDAADIGYEAVYHDDIRTLLAEIYNLENES